MDKIKFYQIRDLGETIRDSYRYLTQQSPTLWRVLFTYILPAQIIITLISAVLSKDYYIELYGLMQSIIQDPDNAKEVMESFILQGAGKNSQPPGTFLLSVATILLTLYKTVLPYNSLKISVEKGDVSQSELHQRTMKDMGWYVGYAILMGLTFIILYLAIIFLVVFLAAILPGFVAGVLGFAVFGIFIYIGVLISIFWSVCFFENLTFVDALTRTSRLLKGSYWLKTFGLLFLMFIGGMAIFFVIAMISAICYSLMGLGGAIIVYLLVSTILTFFYGILTTYMLNFHYASVRTAIEGNPYGDNELIDQIGDFK